MTREERKYWLKEKIKAMVTVVLIVACIAIIEAITA